MAIGAFDRETLLDLTVNFVPLGILAFFIVLFLVNNPFGTQQPIYIYLQMGIVGLSFVLLAILTYFSGKAIAEDEKRREAGADATTDDADESTVDH